MAIAFNFISSLIAAAETRVITSSDIRSITMSGMCQISLNPKGATSGTVAVNVKYLGSDSFEPLINNGSAVVIDLSSPVTHSNIMGIIKAFQLVPTTVDGAYEAVITGWDGVDLSLLEQLSDSSESVSVSDHGAVGDGVSDDSDAIISAINAAGTNGVVVFSPNKTYLVSKNLPMYAGQTFIGYGATIKRAAQIITTTVASITNGVTNTFPVADSTGFRVGQSISVFNGSNYSNQNLTISEISGNTIVTANAAALTGGSPFSGTTYVALSFDLITPTDGCTIIGLSINGNKANWTYYRWEITTEIHSLMSSGGFFKAIDCKIDSAPGEAIQENSTSAGNILKNNHITNSNGNGIHLSGSTGTLIDGNYIYNSNINGSTVGHNGGAIAVSNSVVDLTISNNQIDTARSGVGQVDSSDNSFLNIVGNTIKNMSAYMLEIRGYNASVTDVAITGNRFYNTSAPAAAALICVDIGDTNSDTFSRVVVSSNDFDNCGINLHYLHNAVMNSNCLRVAYQASDTYHNLIKCDYVKNVSIVGNSTRNGFCGINLDGTNGNVIVSGNTVQSPYYYGIYDNGNATIKDNVIEMDANVNAGSAQALPSNGDNSVISGNTIKMVGGFCGIRVNGVANTVVQSNTVRGAGAGKSIRVETGSTGYVVSENNVNAAVTDVPGVGVRVANNSVIT